MADMEGMIKTHKAPLTVAERQLIDTLLPEAIRLIETHGRIDESKFDEWGVRPDKDSKGKVLPRHNGPTQLHLQRMLVLTNPVGALHVLYFRCLSRSPP